METIYVEEKPWAILAGYYFYRNGYKVKQYVDNVPPDSNVIVSSVIGDRGGILITPTFVRWGDTTKEFSGVDELLGKLIPEHWLVKYASNIKLYVILDAYGINSYKYLKDTFEDTVAYNSDLLDKFTRDYLSYRDSIRHDELQKYKAVVVRDNRLNLGLSATGSFNLIIAIMRKNGRAFLHVTGKDYLGYTKYMKGLGMQAKVIDDNRGAYLSIPNRTGEPIPDDIDTKSIKDTMKGYYEELQ